MTKMVCHDCGKLRWAKTVKGSAFIRRQPTCKPCRRKRGQL